MTRRDTAENIGATAMRIGHDLSLTKAREWVLHISTSRNKTSIGREEPTLFAEPGLFLIDSEDRLSNLSVQPMPFMRLSFLELLGAVDFVIEQATLKGRQINTMRGKEW